MQGKMIRMGRRSDDLYVLDPTNLFPTLSHISSVFNNVYKTNHELWHTSLGHPSYVRLNLLKNILNFKQVVDHSPHCSICHLAKQKWLQFPISHFQFCFTMSFDLLHVDIWGAFHLPKHDGFLYFLTNVDDYSHFTSMYLLKAKSNVNSIFLVFCILIHTQFGGNIRSLHSDNAPKLAFSDYFS